MRIHGLNLLAIFAAALSAFVIGGLWYSPVLFGRSWKLANGFEDRNPAAATANTFLISFVFSLVMAYNLAAFLSGGKTTPAWGATAGLLAGFGWITMGLGIVSLFERRPWKYVLVNGGYLTITLVIMGLILGSWR
jgi:Protein of unknown function (DUF1761)